MKHSYRECIVERLFEWQIVDIRLNDVGILQFPGRFVRRFHRGTKVDTNNVSCRPLRNKLSMPSLTTTTFEYNLVLTELWRDWLEPTQELLGVACIFLCEVLPLPTKVLRSFLFVAIDLFEIRKARNAPNN